MQRPVTKKLVSLKSPPYGLVLKREYSDSCRDVYIPSNPPKRPEEAHNAAAFTEARMAEGKNDSCSWLCQEFVPFLSTGEIRFMCIGGIPVREVVTGRFPQGCPSAPGGGLWFYERNSCLKTIAALQ